MHMGLVGSAGSHLKCCSSESCTHSWWLAVSCCAGTGSREHPLGNSSSWLHLIVTFISSTRSVLHGVILLLLSTMILCSAKSWPWILLSTQRRKSRTQQRGPAVVLSLNSAWIVSGPGDNRNWIHSWQLQTWVWMWLLEVVREMFTFQGKQFCKILQILMQFCYRGYFWGVHTGTQSFHSRYFGCKKGCRFISVSTVSQRTSLLFFLAKVHSASKLFRGLLLQSGPFVL